MAFHRQLGAVAGWHHTGFIVQSPGPELIEWVGRGLRGARVRVIGPSSRRSRCPSPIRKSFESGSSPRTRPARAPSRALGSASRLAKRV